MRKDYVRKALWIYIIVAFIGAACLDLGAALFMAGAFIGLIGLVNAWYTDEERA